MTDENPYLLPASSFHVVNVSGGRTSGYMLRQILDAHGGALPDHAEAIFTNTGKERPETLDFIARMQAEWGVRITWLEFRYRTESKGGATDPKLHYEIVSHNSASRNGEPFDDLIVNRKMLPNQAVRACTSELKVKTIERYMRRERGLRPASKTRPAEYINVLGIRRDEPRRWQKAAVEECPTKWPLVLDMVTREIVGAFWKQQSFDLGIPSWKGNCDLCFLKGKNNLLRTLRQNPSVGSWWSAKEAQISALKKNAAAPDRSVQWSKRHSVEHLLAEAAATPELPLIDDDEGGIDCFCGD